ncbi:putative Elp3 domain-containing protein [Gammaproteobacteria bacterium]
MTKTNSTISESERIYPYFPLQVVNTIEGTILVHRHQPWWAAINASAVGCVRQLAGRDGGGMRLRKITVSEESREEVSEKDVHTFAAQLNAAGLLAATPTVIPTPRADSLFLHLTEHCNLSCNHCCMDSGPDRHRALSIATVLRLVDEHIALGGHELVLSGGEPLTWPGLDALLERTHNTGITVRLLTNGTQLDEQRAHFIAARVDEVQISLDGTNAAMHDAIRGPGSFLGATTGARYLLAAGLPNTHLTFSAQISSALATVVESFLILAEQLGAGAVRFLPVRPSGRAADQGGLQGLSGPALADFFDRVHALKQQWRERLHISSGLSGLGLSNVPQPWCPVGKKLTVTAEGVVYPCALLMGNTFSLGNIHTQDLATILRGSAYQQVVEKIHRRIDHTPACLRCEWRAFCQGGCVGMALSNAGAINTPEGPCGCRRRWYTDAAARVIASGD